METTLTLATPRPSPERSLSRFILELCMLCSLVGEERMGKSSRSSYKIILAFVINNATIRVNSS